MHVLKKKCMIKLRTCVNSSLVREITEVNSLPPTDIVCLHAAQEVFFLNIVIKGEAVFREKFIPFITLYSPILHLF